MQTKFFLGLALAIGLVIGIGIWLLVAPKAAVAPGMTASSTAQSTGTSTVVNLGNGVGVQTTGGHATVEVVADSSSSVQHPSLTRPITFGSGVSASQQATLTAEEQSDLAALTKDPTRVDLWLKLGNERKLAGDYQGAIDAWTYVAKAGPASINYIAYGNLADLYTNWDQDFAKAAADYKAAIAAKPEYIDFYRNYAGLYLNYGYDKAGVVAALAQGLKANPGNKDLLAIQAQVNAK